MLMPAQTETEVVEEIGVRPKRGPRRSMVLPEAFDERVMPSLQLARSSRWARRIGNVMAAILVVGFILVFFAPWQQSVRGAGDVIAYSPEERMQWIEATTKGRITQWGDGIYENARVTKGQLIATIQDLDEGYVGRLEQQLATAKETVQSLKDLVDATNRQKVAAETLAATQETQVATYKAVREGVEASALAAIDAAESKVTSAEQKLQEVLATELQAKQDFERQRRLYDKDIASEVKFQQAQQKYTEAQAKVAQEQANIDAFKADLIAKEKDLISKERKAQADIEYSQALLDKARGDVAKTDSDISKSESELQKAEQELFKAETALARQQTQVVTAPVDGFLTQIMANQGSSMLKEGDKIAMIVPDTADRAVQVWLDGNDAPLVEPGRHVRLQFEGWPAVQFAGWPSVAVGTFGGTVVSVDATDDGKGQFRVIVRPDPTEVQEWPSDRYLRQGVRANGWVLLEQVPLWYELWRNMNGFPPSIDPDGDADKEKGRKAPKLPK